MEYLFLFPLLKNCKNRPRNAGVIFDNKMALFPGHGVIMPFYVILLHVCIRKVACDVRVQAREGKSHCEAGQLCQCPCFTDTDYSYCSGHFTITESVHCLCFCATVMVYYKVGVVPQHRHNYTLFDAMNHSQASWWYNI